MYTPYIVDDNTRGESLEFVISRSQVQIPSVAPLKNQAPMRVSRGCCFCVKPVPQAAKKALLGQSQHGYDCR